MATVELTKDNFAETVLGEGKIAFVDFWADWCGPCKMFAPIFERVAVEHPDIVFGKVDTEAEQELAGTFQVMSIPTLVILRDSVVLFQQPGVLPEEALEQLVEKVAEVDMDEVREQLAARA